MDNKKPECSDFIVAAVRRLRRNPANITAGTNSGMNLERLWKVALEKYSEDEFRGGLEILLADNVVLITALHVFDSPPYSEVTVTVMPSSIGDCHCWHLNEQREYLDSEASDELRHSFIRNLLVYVQADGLPKKAQRIKDSTCRRSVAQSIVESIE